MSNQEHEQEIQLTVRDKGQFPITLALPDSTTVSDLIDVIQHEEPGHFPRVDQNGGPVFYRLSNVRTNTFLEPEATMKDAGVQDNDVLDAYPKFLGARA